MVVTDEEFQSDTSDGIRPVTPLRVVKALEFTSIPLISDVNE